MSALHRVLVLPLLVVALSCAAAPTTSSTSETPPAKSALEKEHGIAEARVGLVVAETKREHQLVGAQAEIAGAQADLAAAERELQTFVDRTAPHELEQARLSHDEAAYRAEEARAELAELEAMYKADQFAAMTKELVLQRGRRQLEVADRRLALSKAELATKQEVEHVGKRKELEAKVAASQRALAKAERGLALAKLEGERDVLAATNALAKAEAKE